MDTYFYKYGLESGTDKVTHHGYHRFYPKFIKTELKKILEIGVQEMNSINLWRKLCPSAYIYGFDINVEYKDDNVKIIKGDQSNTNDLDNLVKEVGNDVDFILDDGSHVPEHQILTFIKLFPNLIQGGVYIIEDIETSYWINKPIYSYQLNYGFKHPINLINVFSNILHIINREFITNPNEINEINKVNFIVPLDIIDTISTITFGQNCIIIKKKEEYEYQYNNRIYRFT